MSCRRVGAGLIAAAIGSAALPAVALAAPVGLKGETLSISERSQDPPFPFVLPCAGFDGTGPASFTFSGTATGPYAGPFTETGSVTYSSENCGPPAQEIPLQSYSATFTIDAPNGTVSGTETMTGSAEVTSDSSAGGSGVSIGPVSTTYTATITKPHKVCTLHGTSTATLDQALGVAWSASLQDGPFTSPRSASHCRAHS